MHLPSAECSILYVLNAHLMSERLLTYINVIFRLLMKWFNAEALHSCCQGLNPDCAV